MLIFKDKLLQHDDVPEILKAVVDENSTFDPQEPFVEELVKN